MSFTQDAECCTFRRSLKMCLDKYYGPNCLKLLHDQLERLHPTTGLHSDGLVLLFVAILQRIQSLGLDKRLEPATESSSLRWKPDVPRVSLPR